MRQAKDADGPLKTATRTWVCQYDDKIHVGPNQDKEKQHHWIARTRIINSNSAFKGHYYHEVVYPYAPEDTVMVDPEIVVWSDKEGL